MIQNQTFEGFPIFGDNSSMSQPEAAIYSNGFAPADVLPAEYYNWLTYKASKGITDLNKGVVSMEAELNNVVSAGGQEPSENTNNQIITAIRYLINQAKAEAILAAHPVGSLYWSSKDTNPGTLFGGTWKRIKDRFVYAMGDNDSVDVTGGNATITLTTQNLPSHTHTGPSHTHSYTPSGSISVTTNPTFTGTAKNTTSTVTNSSSTTTKTLTGSYGPFWASGSPSGTGIITAERITDRFGDDAWSGGKYTFSIDAKHEHRYTASGTISGGAYTFTGTEGTTGSASTGNTGATGGGVAFNNMPPFVNKYCWERTA